MGGRVADYGRSAYTSVSGFARKAYAKATDLGKRIAQAALKNIPPYKRESGHLCWHGVKSHIYAAIPGTEGRLTTGNAREATAELQNKLKFKRVPNSGNPLKDPVGTVHVYVDVRNPNAPGHVDVTSVDESGQVWLISDFRAKLPPSPSYYRLVATLAPPDAPVNMSNIAKRDYEGTIHASRLALLDAIIGGNTFASRFL